MNREECLQILERAERRIEDNKKMTSTPHHLTEIAAALRAQVAEVERLEDEVERLKMALNLASPMLRAGIEYHQKKTQASRLPESEECDAYELEAGNALFRMRSNYAQKGAQDALDILAAPFGTKGS